LYHNIAFDIGSILLSVLHCCATLLLSNVSEIERQAMITLKVMKTLLKTLFVSVKGNSEAKSRKRAEEFYAWLYRSAKLHDIKHRQKS